MSRMCVIYTKDEVYGKRLLASLTQRTTRKIVSELVCSREELDHMLEKAALKDNVVGVITDEDSFDETLTKCCEGILMILTEEQMSAKQIEASYGGDVIGIYRYQPVKQVQEKIIDAIEGKKKMKLKGVEILGVYSPICIPERQAFALNIAKVLSERYKVLYINLDAFSGLKGVLPDSSGEGLSDAIYYYRQGGIGATAKIKDTISSMCGVDYMAPIRCQEDVECMSTKELVEFIMCVARSDEYEYVVLDMYGARSDIYKLMDICTQVYIPVRDDYIGIHKLQEFEMYHCEIGREDLIASIEKVKLPQGELEVNERFWERVTTDGMYRYVKSLLAKEVG